MSKPVVCIVPHMPPMGVEIGHGPEGHSVAQRKAPLHLPQGRARKTAAVVQRLRHRGTPGPADRKADERPRAVGGRLPQRADDRPAVGVLCIAYRQAVGQYPLCRQTPRRAVAEGQPPQQRLGVRHGFVDHNHRVVLGVGQAVEDQQSLPGTDGGIVVEQGVAHRAAPPEKGLRVWRPRLAVCNRDYTDRRQAEQDKQMHGSSHEGGFWGNGYPFFKVQRYGKKTMRRHFFLHGLQPSPLGVADQHMNTGIFFTALALVLFSRSA